MSKPNNAVRGEIQHTIYCRHSVKPEARSFSDKFISSIRHPAESLHLLLSTEKTFCQMHLLGPAVRSNQTITTSLNSLKCQTCGSGEISVLLEGRREPLGRGRLLLSSLLFMEVGALLSSPVAWTCRSHLLDLPRVREIQKLRHYIY